MKAACVILKDDSIYLELPTLAPGLDCKSSCQCHFPGSLVRAAQEAVYTPLLPHLMAYVCVWLTHLSPCWGFQLVLFVLLGQHLAQRPARGDTEYTRIVLNYKSFVWNSAHIPLEERITNESGSLGFPTSPQQFT